MQEKTSSIKCFKCLGRGPITSQCPAKKTMIIRSQDIYSSQDEATTSPSSSESEEAKKEESVEAMPSKIILMMPKNQELSKFQRIRSQKALTIKFQDSRTKNNQVSRTIKIKIQDSRFKNQEKFDFKIQEKMNSSFKRRINQDKY